MDDAVAAALRGKPAVRNMLKEQCGGNWDLVVVDNHGGFSLANNAAQAERMRERLGQVKLAPPPPPPPPPPPVAKKASAAKAPPPPADVEKAAPAFRQPIKRTVIAKSSRVGMPPARPLFAAPPAAPTPPVLRTAPPAPPAPTPTPVQEPVQPPPPTPPSPPSVVRTPRAPKTVEPTIDLATAAERLQIDLTEPDEKIDLAQSIKSDSIRPGVNIITVSQQERQERLDRVEIDRKAWRVGDLELAQTFDWATIELPPVAHQFWERYKDGYPAALGFQYSPDVMALAGMDIDIVQDAMLQPDRVEIRPETYDKGYPVLGFYRGDVKSIVGFREPRRPMVIAAYAHWSLGHDTHRVNYSGGGGAKKSEGVPTTVTKLISALRSLGAIVAYDELNPRGVSSAEVKFKDNVLGKINVGPTAKRMTVEGDWQRMQRKIYAIKQRLDKVG